MAGIQYEECDLCHKVAGHFPAVRTIVETLAKTIVQKPSALTGPEIRYLRKYMGKTNVDFAQLIGVSPHQVSLWENGHNPPERSADKLMRLLIAYRSNPEEVDRIASLIYSTPEKESYLLLFRHKRWSGVWRSRS